MKANTEEAIRHKDSWREMVRDAEKRLGQNNMELEKLKKKLKAEIYDIQLTIRNKIDPSSDMLDTLIDARDCLQFILDGLERIEVVEIDDVREYGLMINDERIKEAASYSAGQSELEKLLQEKLDRNESINQYLVGGSYAIRRAAKTVLKRNKNGKDEGTIL